MEMTVRQVMRFNDLADELAAGEALQAIHAQTVPHMETVDRHWALERLLVQAGLKTEEESRQTVPPGWTRISDRDAIARFFGGG